MMTRNMYVPRPKDLVPAKIDKIDPMLRTLLGICSPHGHEHHISNYIKGLSYIPEDNITEIDGNLLIEVGDTSKITTMFSCHMDIIGQNGKHNTDQGKVDRICLMTPTKTIEQDYLYGAKVLGTEYKPCPLGADDKVGVYILLKMIQAKIPGLYAFHVGEEVGGKGSALLVSKYKDNFIGLDRAIAFDRAGYGDVIEWQRGGRCCSVEFGKSLADQLNSYMPPLELFKSGITGTFTDTANYREIIPECTNISVGYFQQHGETEHMDWIWLKHILLPAILKLDFNALPTKRNPKEKPYTYQAGNGSSWWPKKDNDGYATRVTWEKATVNTPLYNLPFWGIKDGYKETADGVLRKAIQEYMLRTYQHAERYAIADYMHDFLEENHLQELEIANLKEQIKLLTNKHNNGTVEDLEISRKKGLIKELVSVADKTTLVSNQNFFKSYSIGAKKLLKVTEGKVLEIHYEKKELRKMNRIIFMMSYYLSLEDVLTEDVSKLLMKTHHYITTHITEEGFSETPYKETKKDKVVILADEQTEHRAIH